MTIKRNLEGMVFNNLRVLRFSRYSEPLFSNGKNKGRRKFWMCLCEKCGKISEEREDNLLNGHSKSCGCLQRESVTKHGQWSRDNSLFWRYNMIVQRCYNPNNKSYKDYGGRGIKMCDEWKNNSLKFIEWAYKNGYNDKAINKKCTLDRIDNNGNYCPENCRFITQKQNSRNMERCHIIEYRGEKRHWLEWCEILGISKKGVEHCVARYGFTYQQAFDRYTTQRFDVKLQKWVDK